MSKQLTENALKLAYFIKSYPDIKEIEELRKMFRALPLLDFNCAAWYAEDQGWIKVDQINKTMETDEADVFEDVDFGENVNHLKELMVYTVGKFAIEEMDVEEELMSSFTSGYEPQDIMIAMKHLLDTGEIKTYRIIDSVVVKKATKKRGAEVAESAYDYYTLPENYDKEWGSRDFKGKIKLEKLDTVVQ